VSLEWSIGKADIPNVFTAGDDGGVELSLSSNARRACVTNSLRQPSQTRGLHAVKPFLLT
jgi:hypothetical protein